MLKFAFLNSDGSPVPLPETDDHKLRRAFGRFGAERSRIEGAKVVSNYYGKNGCFLCDCRPDEKEPPKLFLIEGTHIRREDREGRKGTPHHHICDFAYEPDEQKAIVRSWQPLKKNEYNLNLVREFVGDDYKPSPRASFITTRSRAPKLARVLFNLLHDAKIDRLYATTPLHGKNIREKQIAYIEEAAAKFTVTPDLPLSDWLATSLSDFYSLKKKLAAAKQTGWKRPYGLFIEIFDQIKDKALHPRKSELKPIPITGNLKVFGEKDNYYRPPYLVVGSVTFPTGEATEAELYNVYAHPCLDHHHLMTVDSDLERDTLQQLIRCRDWLHKSRNVAVSIEKPMFDIGMDEGKDPRDVCRPDFVLRCRKGNSKDRLLIIVETMGYRDAEYRERKGRLRPLFENIKGGIPPHPVIEHDRFDGNMKPDAIDEQFRKRLLRTILEKCPGE